MNKQTKKCIEEAFEIYDGQVHLEFGKDVIIGKIFDSELNFYKILDEKQIRKYNALWFLYAQYESAIKKEYFTQGFLSGRQNAVKNSESNKK